MKIGRSLSLTTLTGLTFTLGSALGMSFSVGLRVFISVASTAISTGSPVIVDDEDVGLILVFASVLVDERDLCLALGLELGERSVGTDKTTRELVFERARV